MNSAENIFSSIEALCEEINSLTEKLTSSRIIFFSEISLKVKFNHPELCFSTLVSWLYVLYQEAARRNLDFITKKFQPYRISISSNAGESKKLIHAFRTVLQHQMDFVNSQSDLAKKNLCDHWYYTLIQKNEPTTAEDWTICVNELLNSAHEYIKAILVCLKMISRNEHREIVIEEWVNLSLRDYSSYDFENVLVKVLNRLGLANIFDTNVLAKKHHSSWKKELDVLPDDFIFEEHATRIIERFIIKKEILPINGNDIIALGVAPGPRVLELLAKARDIFYNEPCSKEMLLKKLI